ncbi:MAG TPA: restriction endonuclease [Verrucomicrobiae bacterium]|nr:restriction endonuclease [Verrucomicrobiae bacterium]
MDSPHLAPKLVIEKPITPNLTLSLRAEAQQAKIQRWYDVSLDTLNRVGFKSVDFLPDGIAKLLDKAGNEIFHSSVKLTDEFDGLPMLLAQIEKTWWQTAASGEFWPSVCNLMIRSGVPSFRQITPAHHVLTRIFWLEACCFWMAYLAKLRVDAGEQDWSDLALGSALIPKFVDFYNESPNRGPEIQEPIYNVDRNKLYAFLDAVRRASTNDEKKKALESLASVLFGGLSGFEVFPNRITATGEIDRWVRNSCTYPTISLLGTPILVECKHWQQAVGTDPVGAFIADLEDARLNSGFLLCRKSVSGPAIRRIQNYYQRTKGYVLVFSEDEVQNVCDGESLARMIVEKVESIVLPKP